MRVISASRRTDIPAFYSDWFMNRIREGSAQWVNPFGGKTLQVSLKPEDCTAIVFWTRNPAPLLPHLKTLNDLGYRYYFLFTINGYPKPMEERTPVLDVAIAQFKKLSDIVSPEFVQWRYDPIIIGNRTPFSWHQDRFQYLSEKLHHYTKRCYFSFVSWYGKTKRNFKQLNEQQDIAFIEPAQRDKQKLLSSLSHMARAAKMNLFSCCNDTLLGAGIEKAHCVDLDILRALRPDLNLTLSMKPTRQECGCYESSDIGAYDTCGFGCSYCYATNNHQTARENLARHDPHDSFLLRPPSLQEKAGNE